MNTINQDSISWILFFSTISIIIIFMLRKSRKFPLKNESLNCNFTNLPLQVNKHSSFKINFNKILLLSFFILLLYNLFNSPFILDPPPFFFLQIHLSLLSSFHSPFFHFQFPFHPTIKERIINQQLNNRAASYIKPCKKRDPDINACITRSIDQLRDKLSAGIPEFEAPPIEPLYLKQIRLSRGPIGARLDVNLTDLRVNLSHIYRHCSFFYDWKKYQAPQSCKYIIKSICIDYSKQFFLNTEKRETN